MTIDKIVKRLIVSIGVPILVSVGILTGYNFYAHHNVSYETNDKKVVQKADGIMAFTTLEIDKEDGSVKISREHPLNWRSYSDEDRDNNVDRIWIGGIPFVRGSHSKTFYRDKHLKQYPKVFERADQDFRQQMKRFKPYINR